MLVDKQNTKYKYDYFITIHCTLETLMWDIGLQKDSKERSARTYVPRTPTVISPTTPSSGILRTIATNTT